MDSRDKSIVEPTSYFEGMGPGALRTPTNVLLFLRTSKHKLQQEALLNRSHHRFVLVLNRETEGRVHVDNLVLPLRPGQALLILPYQFHHYSQLSSPSLQWLFCTFDFEPGPFLEPLRNQVVDMSAKTRQAAEALTGEWNTDPVDLKAEQIQVRSLHLLISLRQDCHRSTAGLPVEPTNNLIRSVNRQMEEWRRRPVLVSDLANALAIPQSRLRVLFKEAAGIPLGSYIHNYRLNRAMALLRTTDLAIAEIAEETGFGSPQAFSGIFKKKTGQTPRSYRRPPGLP